MSLQDKETRMKNEIKIWLQKLNLEPIGDLLNVICQYCRDGYKFIYNSTIHRNKIKISGNNISNFIYTAEDDCYETTVRLIESGIWCDITGIHSLLFRINRLSNDCIRFGILSDIDKQSYNYVSNVFGGYLDTINQWKYSYCFDNITGDIIDGKQWKNYTKPRIIQKNDIVEMIINLNINIVSFKVYQSCNNMQSKYLGIAYCFQNARKFGNIHPFVTLMHYKDSISLIQVKRFC